MALGNLNLDETSIMRQIKGDYTAFVIAPWFHVMGFVGLYMGLMIIGIDAVYLSKFEPELFLECIQVAKII